MRKFMAVVGVALAGVLVFKSFVAPSNVLADAGSKRFQVSIFGLHVAQANGTKSFPAELVPLP